MPELQAPRLINRRGGCDFSFMRPLSSVCVYCGAGFGADPGYAEAARRLGRAWAEADLRLVYGGGSVGLMVKLARAPLEAGGAVTGIIPSYLQRRARPMDGLTALIVTDDMHERKMIMFEQADAFVALPGGVGTREELVEQMTWAQLGRQQTPILLANVLGFWDGLIALLEHLRAERFIRPGMDVPYVIAESVEEIVPKLLRAAAEPPAAPLEAEAAAPLNRM